MSEKTSVELQPFNEWMFYNQNSISGGYNLTPMPNDTRQFMFPN